MGGFRSDGLDRADRRRALTLDFGDGFPTWSVDATGQVKHVYSAPGAGTPHPWIVTPVLQDADNFVRGQQHFEIPHGRYRPWEVSASAF